MSSVSRYQPLSTYSVKLSDGRVVRALRLPQAGSTRLLGYHRRLESQRLDHLAAHYLADATAFWKLCDANEVLLPDALAAAELIGIPPKG